jgi:hypothetical protein
MYLADHIEYFCNNERLKKLIIVKKLYKNHNFSVNVNV